MVTTTDFTTIATCSGATPYSVVTNDYRITCVAACPPATTAFYTPTMPTGFGTNTYQMIRCVAVPNCPTTLNLTKVTITNKLAVAQADPVTAYECVYTR